MSTLRRARGYAGKGTVGCSMQMEVATLTRTEQQIANRQRQKREAKRAARLARPTGLSHPPGAPTLRKAT